MTSPKSLTKTRWVIDANRVVVYPHRISYLLGILVALVFAGIVVAYLTSVHGDTFTTVCFFIFLVAVPLWFLGYGNTYVEFDGSRGTMQRKLFGLIPVKTMYMNDLHGINIVTQNGGYKYKMFSKKDRYGRGVLVSSGYRKNTDANAQAFVDQVVPVIHGYLDKYGSIVGSAPQPITSYKYYNNTGGSYTVKSKKVLVIIFSLIFFAVGIYAWVAHWAEDVSPTQKILVVVICLGLGLIVLQAAFVSIVFDTGSQTIIKRGPLGWGNKSIPFSDFAGFQTIRKSTNMVYTGTEVHMYYRFPNSEKKGTMLLHTFKSSGEIERFLEETKSVMKI
ncbi:hypothetical protein [Mucilaginibacter lappiensis]|uniref:Uncharacterized protein n=1 Tax=Mucilaginibacter lappiensis TaxID=354630 RepID=A0A841JGW0_9SPHI|nr:hypothetical protein [Mucilaginibacter lappiensis]MBB6129764.1 hypothetical protein [Mucilaginibacter lappiensis]